MKRIASGIFIIIGFFMFIDAMNHKDAMELGTSIIFSMLGLYYELDSKIDKLKK